MVKVERLWPGSTIVCAGSGPSLTASDLEYCRDHGAKVIVVNDAYTLAPWADVLYACDSKWWRWHRDALAFKGLRYALQAGMTIKGVQQLRNMGRTGLSLDPSGLKNGYNSGYQAINLAVLLGAKRIVLLGYDMSSPKHGPAHFFGSHPDKSKPPYDKCLEAFKTLVEPLQKAHVEIVNCTRSTALTCFPCAPLESVLVEVAA